MIARFMLRVFSVVAVIINLGLVNECNGELYFKPMVHTIKSSYVQWNFYNVTESNFPSPLSIEMAISTFRGTLIYSHDKYENQFILSFRGSIVEIDYINEQNFLTLQDICGCSRSNCINERLRLDVEISNGFYTIKCNQGQIKRTNYVREKKYVYRHYPILPFSQKIPGNKARMWLGNHQNFPDLIPDNLQMVGCIFEVKYNNQILPLSNAVGPDLIRGKCPRLCNIPNVCNDGQCIETYSSTDIRCNCTKSIYGGRTCNDTLVNSTRLRSSLDGSLIKIGWRQQHESHKLMIREKPNNTLILNLTVQQNDFYFIHNISGNEILSKSHFKKPVNICIITIHYIQINILCPGLETMYFQLMNTLGLKMKLESYQVFLENIEGISYKMREEQFSWNKPTEVSVDNATFSNINEGLSQTNDHTNTQTIVIITVIIVVMIAFVAIGFGVYRLKSRQVPNSNMMHLEESQPLLGSSENIRKFEGFTKVRKLNKRHWLEVSLYKNEDKQLAVRETDRNGLKSIMKAEAKILQKIGTHPNIIEFSGLFHHENMLYITHQYYGGGTINAKLTKDNRPFDIKRIIHYSKCIADALDFIHSKQVIHLNVNTENILLDGENNVRLTDFTFAESVDGKKNKLTRRAIKDNPRFLAWEFFTQNEVTSKSDVWALGCCIIHMASGKLPFYDYRTDYYIEEYLREEKKVEYDSVGVNDADIKEIISQCTASEVDNRPSAGDLVNELNRWESKYNGGQSTSVIC